MCDRGSIISINSFATFVGLPSATLVVYNSNKNFNLSQTLPVSVTTNFGVAQYE